MSLLSLELSTTALAAVRGAAMALGEVARLLLWSVVVEVFSGFVAFVHLKNQTKKGKERKARPRTWPSGPFGFALWVLVYGA